ncbi:hypothetical protein FBU30_009550 [Linnemannia zychae]|nr:hypothetical protein FBU30_009550 [Linnemannia zychae]
MSRMQTAEYHDLSDSGRRLDCLFMMDDVELSNIVVKHPGSSKMELTIQNRKSVRLARSSIAIAGKTTSTTVHLPRTAGALETFMETGSLAIIWNFISYLGKQGSKVIRAKERFQVAEESAKLAAGLAFPRTSTPPPRDRTFERNVTFTPSKKRVWSTMNSK